MGQMPIDCGSIRTSIRDSENFVPALDCGKRDFATVTLSGWYESTVALNPTLI
jgi:hypothetical protein